MIKQADVCDIPALVEMGRRFHAMSPHRGMGDYDDNAMARMMSFLVEDPSGLLMTNDTGMIGGVLTPVYFDPSRKMMDEAFWWSEGGGMALMEAFCAEAKAMGADFVTISTLENEHSDRIDAAVRRRGFAPIERRYMMEIA